MDAGPSTPYYKLTGELKIAKKDFYFFSNLSKSRVGGFEKLFIKKLWPKFTNNNASDKLEKVKFSGNF